MTAPVERIPGKTYLVTRRCDRREFRLRPDAEMNAAIAVTMAAACARYGVELIATVWMSNHYHAVVHDPRGLLSDWMRDVHAQIARYGNATQGQRWHFWDGQEGNAMELEGTQTVVDAVAYVLANPVAAGLVASPVAWPGLKTSVDDIGRESAALFERPRRFFSADGPVPGSARLTCKAPPGTDPASFREKVGRALRKAVARARRSVRAKGGRFLGAAAVLAQHVFSRPPEDGDKPRRDLGPKRQVADVSPDATRALILRARRFRRAYRECLDRVRAGAKAVVFPPGTYRLWRHYGFARHPPSALNEAAA